MRTTILKLVLPLVAGILTVPATVLAASVWHVATTGNDITGTGSSLLPFATIQRGIDESTNGDTVLVADGTYHERVTFYSKAIEVGSWILRDGDSLHIENTIINGDPVGLPSEDTTAVVRIVSAADSSEIRGFTIVNGPSDGILCVSSRLRVTECVLTGNGVRLSHIGILEPLLTLNRTLIIGAGVATTTSGETRMNHCTVTGKLESLTGNSFHFAPFQIDSSSVGEVDLNVAGFLQARATTFSGPVHGLVTVSAYVYDCSLEMGISAGVEGYLFADSCTINGISCGSENWSVVARSTITGPIRFTAGEMPPLLKVSHCTLLDSILRISGQANLTIDTCIVDLPSPMQFDQYWRQIRIHGSNVYAGGSQYFSGSYDTLFGTFDTTNVISLPPQFCNPAMGDYSIFSTSPCAPANNAFGILMGSEDVGCLNEHVWHVSTAGDDTLGNGTAAAPFATIQKGIDRAENGDTVLVADGLYHERISFGSKAIIVGSTLLRDLDTLHSQNTIIDADTIGLPLTDTTWAVRFVNSNDKIGKLVGFTIRNGSSGVVSFESSPIIEQCIFESNGAMAIASGYFIDYLTQFKNCRFENCGVGTVKWVLLQIDNCSIDSSLENLEPGSDYGGIFTVNYSTIGNIRTGRRNSFEASHSEILRDIDLSAMSGCSLLNCSVIGTIRASGESLITADSCRLFGVHTTGMFDNCDISRSVINGPVRVGASPFNLRSCTVLGAISGTGAYTTTFDSCIIVQQFPIDVTNWHLRSFCTDVYVPAGPAFTGVPLTIDTSNVFSLSPLFCDPDNNLYTISDTSPCAPANNSCGVQIGALGIGCLDVSPNIWTFGNSQANMWPESWWQQFNYCFGISPCQQLCLACSPSTFPDWDLFASAIGEDQAYLDPPPGSVNYRPSAVAQWEALRGEWTGSCFGFAATSFLFFDDYFDVETVFPGNSSLSTVPLNAASRALVNKYYLYQFGYTQQQKINNALGTTTPSQTLAECQTMFSRIPRNDQVLMMFNQTGSGGHAVAPYRTIQDGTNPNLWHLYVHDSNIPNDTTQRVMINLEADTWSYTGQPSWGGTTGLFLLDTVSTYLAPLVLADTTDQSEKIRFYFGAADSVLIEAAADSIGFNEQDPFGDITGVTPIVPADGMGTMPIGYFLPSGEWYFRASGVIDGVFTVVDGEKRIFRNGGAKSGIISCYFKANATLASLTAYGWTEVESPRDIYDSSFIEVISVQPDSEIVITVSGLGLVQGDSVTISLAENQSVQVDNFGDETSYDLEIQIVTPTLDTAFYTENVTIGESTSHLITPDWRPNDDSLLIAIDTTMTGAFDSTITVPNQNTPQFICGDADGNSIVTISDAVFLINYIFAGGPAPAPLVRGDADCNSLVTISDAVYLINYIFAGGAPPCAACK